MKFKRFLLSFFIVAAILIPVLSFAQNIPGPLWLGTKGLPADFYTEVEKGNVPGHSIVHKFGHGNVGTTLVPVSISLKYEMPTAAVSLEIVSDDAADALDDIGSWAYTVEGIDANYDILIQTVAAHATTGLTAVAVPTSLLRLYRWAVSASGTYGTQTAGSHVGALSIRVSGGGSTWSTIEDVPIPQGQSEIGCYSVPDGFRAYIIQQDIHVDSTKSVDVVIMVRQGMDTISAPFTSFKTMAHYVGLTGHNPTQFIAPMDGLPGKTDILYMAKVASSTADVSIHFSIMLIADGY